MVVQAAAGAAGWWWHLPHFSIAAAALVLHFWQELPAGKGHLCFILLDITIYYLEPAVFHLRVQLGSRRGLRFALALLGRTGGP